MEKIFGIDISEFQSKINLEKAKSEGVKFAILRGGYTGYGTSKGKAKDGSFEKHYANCKKLGIGVGAYWYSRAVNKEEGQKEAEYFYNKCLKGKQFEYPVAIDVEDSKYQAKVSKEAVTEAIIGFCEYLENKGYYVSIYANTSWFKNRMNLNSLKNYDKWVAQWSSSRPSSPSGGLWQFGGESNYVRSNKVAGIVCDQNYAYKDYPTLIKNNGLNGFTKDEEPKPVEPVEPKPTEPTTPKFNIGDDVIINGNLYKSANDDKPSGSVKNKKTKIKRYSVGAKHPYNTTGDLGWMNEEDIKPYQKTSTQTTYTVQKGDYLIKIAKKHGVKWLDLAKKNNIKFPYIIRVGQVLKIK